MGQRLRVYRHDAILAEIPAEGTKIWIRHTSDVILKWHPVSQAQDSNNGTVVMKAIFNRLTTTDPSETQIKLSGETRVWQCGFTHRCSSSSRPSNAFLVIDFILFCCKILENENISNDGQ